VNAVVSGRAGVGLLVDGDRLLSFGLGDQELLARTPQEYRALFGSARDVEFLIAIDSVAARRCLQLAVAREDALDLVLSLLDGELRDETRRAAALELDEHLEDESVTSEVAAVLYARPLPEDADPEGAIQCAEGCTGVLAFMERLLTDQPAVQRVHEAWVAVPDDLFSSVEDRRATETLFIRCGLFRELARAVESAEVMNATFVGALASRRVSAVANHRPILQAWIAPLRTGLQIARHAPFQVAESEEPSEQRRRETFDRLASRATVEKMKSSIVDLMNRRDDQRLSLFVEELLEFQRQRGGATFASMSLCDLAMKARTLGRGDLELDFNERAVQLNPEDGWAWAQLGK
jgi:hypothetical protein